MANCPRTFYKLTQVNTDTACSIVVFRLLIRIKFGQALSTFLSQIQQGLSCKAMNCLVNHLQLYNAVRFFDDH